jgi:hypothetical protein
MYFATSKDLLFFILAVSVAVLTVFLVWVLYYIVMIMKDAYRAVKDVQRKLTALDEMIATLKENLTHSTTSLRLMADVVGKIFTFIRDRRQGKEEKETKKKQGREKNQ